MKHRVWKSVLCLALVMIFAIGCTSAFASSAQTVMILKVTADGARVRTGSANGNQVITSLKKNTKVFYMGENEGANCLIRTSDGIFGYVYRGFLRSYGSVRLDRIYYAASDGAKVYKTPSTSASRVASLSAGECVVVFAVSGDWAYVRHINGGSGFMLKSDLRSVA